MKQRCGMCSSNKFGLGSWATAGVRAILQRYISPLFLLLQWLYDLPFPFCQAFNPTFAQLLSQILYNQPQLRPAVLKALKTVVESNVALTSDTQPVWATSDTISKLEASQNIEHLRGQAESWFAVLFNLFGSVGQEGKGVVGDVISAWAGIAGDTVRSGAAFGFHIFNSTDVYRRWSKCTGKSLCFSSKTLTIS